MKNRREGVIEQLKSHYDSLGNDCPNRTGVLFSMSKEQLKDLIDMLSDSERGKGEWIDDKCNCCGEKALYEYYYGTDGEAYDCKLSNFCPHCGADMRK